MLRQNNKKEEKQMEEAVLKYLVVPFIAVLGVYVVGTTIYQLFGVPAIVLFGAVGGIAFFAKFFRR
jgi:cytochrome c-type biogenesis protein CcmH/NrfG